MRLTGAGKLEHLIARACQAITDCGESMGNSGMDKINDKHPISALCCLAENCLRLKELDISGCLNVTNKTLYALQESLLHMRTHSDGEQSCWEFSIVTGGILLYINFCKCYVLANYGSIRQWHITLQNFEKLQQEVANGIVFYNNDNIIMTR